jgi:hypothetical protein
MEVHDSKLVLVTYICGKGSNNLFYFKIVGNNQN